LNHSEQIRRRVRKKNQASGKTKLFHGRFPGRRGRGAKKENGLFNLDRSFFGVLRGSYNKIFVGGLPHGEPPSVKRGGTLVRGEGGGILRVRVKGDKGLQVRNP